MFTGEHERLLDEKGRLVLPSNFRRHLQDTAFLTKSLQAACLMVYSSSEIEKAAARLTEQVQQKSVAADAQRRWAASITEVRTDTQGRIAVPPKLRDEISLEREAIIIGVINRAGFGLLKSGVAWKKHPKETLTRVFGYDNGSKSKRKSN